MNLYLDSSALVKRYISEAGSEDVRQWIAGADFVATSIITLAEMNAAFARGVRMKSISQITGDKAMRLLQTHWPGYIKMPASEKCIHRAAELAWRLGIRGYDAVHVASAELWQEILNIPITFVAYDRQLLKAVQNLGIYVLPGPVE